MYSKRHSHAVGAELQCDAATSLRPLVANADPVLTSFLLRNVYDETLHVTVVEVQRVHVCRHTFSPFASLHEH